jgi:SAM-dependent methyltransferase
VFAGIALVQTLPGGELWRCKSCGFMFRHPLLPIERYRALYSQAGADVWESDFERRDFALVRQCLAKQGAGAGVLDIGCYTGSLLWSLPRHFRLYGVELNQAAARIAASRGIDIVAGEVHALSGTHAKFDVIIACDVIEHMRNPLDFLGQLRARLEPHGRILISTGNADAWLWNALGARFWYCSFPEHISFIGQRWLHSMVGRVGLRLTQLVKFNYRFAAPGPAVVRSLMSTCLFACSPGLYRRLQRAVRGEHAGALIPPGCGATKDHVFCVLTAG